MPAPIPSDDVASVTDRTGRSRTEFTAAFAPIAVTDRDGVFESVHHGVAVAVDARGEVVAWAGDLDLAVFPRSAMKPLQAEAMLEAGLVDLDVPAELLALVCASHDGSVTHVEGVRRLLALADLDESALRTTPDLPLDRDAAAAHVRSGGGRSAITMNCSGKHAGMLLTCVAAGWPLDGYLDPDHPLQIHLTAAIDREAGPVRAVAPDGCGAPAHVVRPVALARAVERLSSVRGEIQRAMSGHPEMVAGPSRAATLVMRRLPGVVAKDGAEGVFVVGVPDRGAVAVKAADGALRAAVPAALALLATLGCEAEALGELARTTVPPVLGHGRSVGRVRSLVGDVRDTWA